MQGQVNSYRPATIANICSTEEEEQQEEEFIYRSQDVPEEESQRTPNGSVRAATSESPSITINRAPALDQDLRQATAFRVPSREAPVMRSSSSRSVPVAVPIGPQWQPDEEATHCSRCNSTFTIFRRKHHCRRCGKVVCASCSNNFDALEPCDVVIDSAALHSVSSLQRREAVHRTCNACHSEIAGRLQSPGEYLGGVPFDSELLSTIVPPLQTPGSPLSSSVSSQTSVLQECPACGLQVSQIPQIIGLSN